MQGRPVILVLGPTASGKTSLALGMAAALPGGAECISADSMQVYRGMDVGTAKPNAAQRAAVPHHLLDIVDPGDSSFSVDRWLSLCVQCVDDIRARGSWPIIVGGTSLYVQALLRGLADVPAPDPALRDRLQELGATELRARLLVADPTAADRIHPNDRKRTIRAIEVFETTGRRLSQLQTQWSEPPADSPRSASSTGALNNTPVIIGLELPVDALNRRINFRVKLMLEQGLMEEVRGLLTAGGLGRNAREALGYKQIIDHLEGRSTLVDAIEQIKIRTRRYAKQQRTWLRRFRAVQPSLWLNTAEIDTQELVLQAVRFVHCACRQDQKCAANAFGQNA